jgi:hypothetical protein
MPMPEEKEPDETTDDAPEPVAEPAVEEFKVEKVEPEPRVNRSARRTNVMREISTAKERAETEARAARDETAKALRELAELRGRFDERERSSQSSQPSKHQEAIEGLRSQWETHAAAAANPKIDESTRRDHVKRAYALEMEIARAQHKMFRDEEATNAPPDQREARDAIERESRYIEGRFPWMEDNKRASRLVFAEFESLVEDGRPRARATMLEACTKIAKQFGFGGREQSAPTGRRFAMVPGGEGAADDDGPMTVRVTDADKRLARAMYPSESEGDAVKKWMKEVAVPHVRAKRESA